MATLDVLDLVRLRINKMREIANAVETRYLGYKTPVVFNNNLKLKTFEPNT